MSVRKKTKMGEGKRPPKSWRIYLRRLKAGLVRTGSGKLIKLEEAKRRKQQQESEHTPKSRIPQSKYRKKH